MSVPSHTDSARHDQSLCGWYTRRFIHLSQQKQFGFLYALVRPTLYPTRPSRCVPAGRRAATLGRTARGEGAGSRRDPSGPCPREQNDQVFNKGIPSESLTQKGGAV